MPHPYNPAYVVAQVPETPPKEAAFGYKDGNIKDPWAAAGAGIPPALTPGSVPSSGPGWTRNWGLLSPGSAGSGGAGPFSGGASAGSLTATSPWQYSPTERFAPAPSSLPTSDDVPSLTSTDRSGDGGDTDMSDELDDDEIQFLGQRSVAVPVTSGSAGSTGPGRRARLGPALGAMPPPATRRGSTRTRRAAPGLASPIGPVPASSNVRSWRQQYAESDDSDDLQLALHDLLPPVVAKPADVSLQRVYDTTPPEADVDDDDGYYIAHKGARFANRYTIVRLLGQGTFGKVYEAVDDASKRRVAIKVIRAIPKYRDASRIELRVLQLLAQYDPAGAARCVRMDGCFDYRNHVCLVTDLLDISVYDFLKENDFMPFPGHHILSFARQLLRSVAFVHGLGVVHTDLKPENILLSSADCRADSLKRGRGAAKPRRLLLDTRVTLIDFGSAIFDDEYHSTVVSTRHYRAPEIILGTGWSFPCDLWSIGCVLVELCTGSVLFQTRDNLEHLAMMEKTLETRFSPETIAAAALKTAGCSLVDVHAKGLRPITDLKRLSAVSKLQPLPWLVRSAVPFNREQAFWTGFLDFVGRLLALDPRDRPTAREALEHPWIRQV